MLKRIKISAWQCKCDKCGHEWRSLKEDAPKHCPNPTCSNPSGWNSGKQTRSYKRTGKYSKQSKQSTEKYETDYNTDFGA